MQWKGGLTGWPERTTISADDDDRNASRRSQHRADYYGNIPLSLFSLLFRRSDHLFPSQKNDGVRRIGPLPPVLIPGFKAEGEEIYSSPVRQKVPQQAPSKL